MGFGAFRRRLTFQDPDKGDEMSGNDRQRRRQATRDDILRVFSTLLFERSYDAIRVADVIARADVGRSTFYEHFPTKLDLLRATLVMPFTPLADVVGDGSPALEGWVHHFRENQALGRVLFAEPTRKVMYRTLAELIEVRLPLVSGLPEGLLAAQIAAAQFALLEPWILGKVALPAETLTEAIVRSSRALVEAAGGRYA